MGMNRCDLPKPTRLLLFLSLDSTGGVAVYQIFNLGNSYQIKVMFDAVLQAGCATAKLIASWSRLPVRKL